MFVAAVAERLVCARRRTSSSFWFASITRWNGYATWIAPGVIRLNTFRYGPNRSSVAHSTRPHHTGPFAASHAHGPAESRPGTTSRSWPRRTSTSCVDQVRVRHRPSRAKRTSSRPRAVTSPIRSGSSTSAVPYAMTASFTVCQSQPSSTATSFTLRAQRPIWAVTHLPARSVIPSRAGAIAGWSSVQLPTRHHDWGHRHRRLRHTSRVGRPKQARSTSSTGSAVLDPRPRCTALTEHRPVDRLDMDPERANEAGMDRDDRHDRQRNKERAHARRVRFHGGSRFCWRQESSESQSPRTHPGTFTPPADPKSPQSRVQPSA